MMRSLFGQVPRSSYFKWSKVIPLHFPRHLSTRENDLRVLVSNSTNPYVNLATEEWLFRDSHTALHTLYLWRNEPTVVIGRHQNPFKECNLKRMEEEGIHLVRRYSGGGAVYQDLGNSIFTFISHRPEYCKEKNTEILVEALRRFGIEAEASGRNDIAVNGRKVSGSAYKLTNDKALHHGTLLVNVDMGKLSQVLHPNKEKLRSKGVQSVQARVLNLVDAAKRPLDHTTLCEAIVQAFFSKYGSQCKVEELDYNTTKEEPLLKKTYEDLRNWSWVYGQTPQFEYNVETRFDWGIMDVYIDSKDGIIADVEIFSDCLFPSLVEELRSALKGARYNEEGIRRACTSAGSKLPEPCNQYCLDFENWLVTKL